VKRWTRDDTREWIAQLENRVEDIDYYLTRAVDWCEQNGVWNDRKVFACCAMTVIWVSHMRNEPISRRELFELLDIKDADSIADAEYTLDPKMLDKEFEEILDLVIQTFEEDED
jgi:hypothetical protein